MFAVHLTATDTTSNFSFYRNNRTSPAACIADDRFRQLLGDADWFSLPATTRARFGRKAVGNRTITYLGEVTHYETGLAGRVLAQIARLIGGPLPLHADLGLAAAVTVTEDEAEGGQIWTRQYGRHRGFPQMIHSVKRFAGSTGLEEYLGRGFGIALKLRVAGGALYFDSDHYFLRLGSHRLALPRWLTPGDLTIGHIDHGDSWFTFTLDLAHPVFGRLIHQQCRFTEAVTGTLQ
ncbi:MAG: hypothetical protein RL367_1590 [Pseudomonadota bacterium]